MAKTTDIKIKRRRGWDDRFLFGITDIMLVLLLLVVAYPLIYVISCSVSSGAAITSGKVLLWPVEFSLDGYIQVFKDQRIWTGFGNSIFYTVVGTSINMILSVLAAYPLSRPGYQGHKLMTIMFTMTMIFSAGMIPTYITFTNVYGLSDSRLGLVIMSGISAYNMIIIRTYFKNSIPSELIEAARIDGCSELRTLCSVVLPLSKAVLAVVTLYYAVGHWNAYFTPMLYLKSKSKYPLQMVLVDILKNNEVTDSAGMDPELFRKLQDLSEVTKYCVIVVTSVPIIAAYPFVQKFFEKGVMIGGVKG